MDKCPFCKNDSRRILAENEAAFLTYAIAPYHKYHLLVIPKRHTESIKELDWGENVCVMALIVSAIKVLDKIGHNDCTVLARDGHAISKSIDHLHYNIIPGGDIEDVSLNVEVRKMLNEEDEKALRKELNNVIGLWESILFVGVMFIEA